MSLDHVVESMMLINGRGHLWTLDGNFRDPGNRVHHIRVPLSEPAGQGIYSLASERPPQVNILVALRRWP